MGSDKPIDEGSPADELELYPDCGEKQLVPRTSTAVMRLCLACGAVSKPSAPR